MTRKGYIKKDALGKVLTQNKLGKLLWKVNLDGCIVSQIRDTGHYW